MTWTWIDNLLLEPTQELDHRNNLLLDLEQKLEQWQNILKTMLETLSKKSDLFLKVDK